MRGRPAKSGKVASDTENAPQQRIRTNPSEHAGCGPSTTFMSEVDGRPIVLAARHHREDEHCPGNPAYGLSDASHQQVARINHRDHSATVMPCWSSCLVIDNHEEGLP